MAFDIIPITVKEKESILEKNENHFFDFKSKDITGKKLQKSIVGMLNADGGEIFVGIEDPSTTKNFDRWRGFEKQEDANQLIQTITQDVEPSPKISFEYYQIKTQEYNGLVLKISVDKSENVHNTSSNEVYIRKNAQNLPIFGQSLVDLKLSKGVSSYEDQLIKDYFLYELIEEVELLKFLDLYSPKTEPEKYLISQRLVRKENNQLIPTVASILLYSINPSAILPKKCAIKIIRYETTELEPQRKHLKEHYTIEGPIKSQIDQSVQTVKNIIESMKIMGVKQLETPKYPIEAIKEIIVNAVIHRDYNISDDIIILIFDNRIEVKSPGKLPGFITTKNILDERFSRNSKIVRLLNKYPDTPNKDIGEGLNTAFQRMKEMRLKSPIIKETEHSVIITLPHELLASPEEVVLEYLKENDEITNKKARELSGISSENQMKKVFYRLRKKDLIEMVPGKSGFKSAWHLKK